MAHLLGAVVVNESGKYDINLPTDQINRNGEANPVALELLAEQATVANFAKNLKKDICRTTKDQISKGLYKGNRTDVNFRLHKDLVKLSCDCNTESDRIFVKAIVSEVKSGLLKSTYNVLVSYACPKCKDVFSGECIFSVSKLKFKKK